MNSGPLREWHDLDGGQQQQAWTGLVAWVTWLRDRYELATRPGLPDCWAQHPGLIEELRALKAWREDIYTSPGPNGQAARYWHTDLRNLISAAENNYARGCASGHRPCPGLAGTDPALQERWNNADPAARIPAAFLSARNDARANPGTTARTPVSEPDMTRLIEAGQARPLGQMFADYIRYGDSWWTRQAGGWRAVTEHALIRQLDQHAGPLQASDAAAARLHGPPPPPVPDDRPDPSPGAATP